MEVRKLDGHIAQTHLDTFFDIYPGFSFCKSQNSTFLGCTAAYAQFFRLPNRRDIIGRTDYNLPGDIIEWADKYCAEDRLVQKEGQLLTLNIHKKEDGRRCILLTEKRKITPVQNEIALIAQSFEMTSDILTTLCNTLTNSTESYRSKHTVEGTYTVVRRDTKQILTERELECLFYLIRGNSQKMIGAKLNISPRTVETHLEHIKDKLNCFSKAQLIEKAICNGYLFLIPYRIVFQKR